jgi:hypothetical protein
VSCELCETQWSRRIARPQILKSVHCSIAPQTPNQTTGAQFGHDPGRSTKVQPHRALGIRPRLYKKRNEIERLFRRLKGFRRIFSRFEKRDVLFLGFLNFALIIEALR